MVRELIVVTINNTDVYIHNDYHMLDEYKLNDNHYKCGIDGLGGDIAGLSMMLISWVLGLLTCTIYLPLQLWSWLALIIGVCFFVWHIMLLRRE